MLPPAGKIDSHGFSCWGDLVTPTQYSLCFTDFLIKIKSDNELIFKDVELCLLAPSLPSHKNKHFFRAMPYYVPKS